LDLQEETSSLTPGFVGSVVSMHRLDTLLKKANRVFAGLRNLVIFSITNFFREGGVLVTTVDRYILEYWHLHCAVQKL
jgi:hypothetical protein